MHTNQHLFPGNTPSRPEITEPLTAIVGAHAARPFDKQAVEAALAALHAAPNLLAIGDQDLDEVIRQDRLAYEEELVYEAVLVAELRQRAQERQVGAIATVHYLSPPEQQTPPPSDHSLAS